MKSEGRASARPQFLGDYGSRVVFACLSGLSSLQLQEPSRGKDSSLFHLSEDWLNELD
jgi:hypothetical protein